MDGWIHRVGGTVVGEDGGREARESGSQQQQQQQFNSNSELQLVLI